MGMLQIQNARHLGAPVDLLVEEAQIVALTPAGHVPPPVGTDIFNACGLILFPSFIDAHVHLREPGYEYKEDIASGLNAAAHGGFGSVMCMANTRPVNDNPAVTKGMLYSAKASHPYGPDLYPIAAATVGLKGEELSPLAELKSAGCVAVSNDGRPIANTEILRRVMEYAGDLNLTLIDHCEDPWLAKGWIINEGRISGKLGLKGQPECGEAIQAARDILLAWQLDLPVHIAHVSSKMTVDLIAWAKEKGIKVTAETAPHYLLLTETATDNYNALAKVSPPLRTKDDQKALLEAVRNGLIDILATDHAPHAPQEKDSTMEAAPCGLSGLDLALALSWKLVEESALSEKNLHSLWCEKPAEIFNLPFNEFNPGNPASFFLFDPDEKWLVNEENCFSKNINTPFLSQTLKGRVKHHWIRGAQLF